MVTEKTDCDASDDDGQVDDAAILEAYCRAQIAELPRGPRGLKAAQALLKAIPDGYRLGLPDTTESARQLFRSLADAGLIAECPSDSDMPSALRLVASVCGLVTQRSQRRWTIWFARACDPDHPLGASIREAVTPAMLRRPSGLSKASETSQRNDLRRAHEVVKQERDEFPKSDPADALNERCWPANAQSVEQVRGNSLARSLGQVADSRHHRGP